VSLRGTVLSLHQWPVKSMGGQPVDVLALDRRGAGGDRTHALVRVHKGRPRRLTAREAPRMLAWQAAYETADGAGIDPASPPLPVLTAPDGRTFAWDDPELPPALATDLGRDVTLRRDLAGQQDRRDTVLVTTEASRAALEREMARPVDLRRFRTNIHLDAGDEPWAEEGWQGGRIRIGDAELELLHPCVRCVVPTRHPDNQAKWADLLRHLTRAHARSFGINARPTGRSMIRVGDPVEVLPA
jgi:uncharacterized protein